MSMSATTVLNLKRNGSVLTDHSSTARKNTRRADVQSFVLTPANEGNLRRKETSLEILHAAMELNKTQFDQLIHPLRDLASHTLDINLPYEQQDNGKWDNFFAKEPLWHKKYENAWPITTYMYRYLYNRAASSRKKFTRSAENSDFKPPARAQLQHSHGRRPARTTGRDMTPHRHPRRGRRHTPSVRENTSPVSTKARAQSYHGDFEQLIDPVQLAETGVSPHVSSPTISSRHLARVPFAPMSSNHAYGKGSLVLSESITQRNKENATGQLPSAETTSSLDPSAPVKEFLCHLGDDLGALLPVFVKKGIKDSATLSEFRKMKDDARAKFLTSWKELDDFQHFRLVALNKQG